MLVYLTIYSIHKLTFKYAKTMIHDLSTQKPVSKFQIIRLLLNFGMLYCIDRAHVLPFASITFKMVESPYSIKIHDNSYILLALNIEIMILMSKVFLNFASFGLSYVEIIRPGGRSARYKILILMFLKLGDGVFKYGSRLIYGGLVTFSQEKQTHSLYFPFFCLSAILPQFLFKIVQFFNTMITLYSINFLKKITRPDLEENQRETKCLICFDIIEEGVLLSCGHAFHRDCLRDWFISNSLTCPIDKSSISFKMKNLTFKDIFDGSKHKDKQQIKRDHNEKVIQGSLRKVDNFWKSINEGDQSGGESGSDIGKEKGEETKEEGEVSQFSITKIKKAEEMMMKKQEKMKEKILAGEDDQDGKEDLVELLEHDPSLLMRNDFDLVQKHIKTKFNH